MSRAGWTDYQRSEVVVQAFLQHVGHQNRQHLESTVTTVRTFGELLDGLPPSAPERLFFETSRDLKAAFPSGSFNCWGLMGAAEPRFKELEVGDLVFMVPHIGIHGGGIQQLGVVKVKCSVRCYEASRILWPNIEDPRKLYPFLFFFDTEVGFHGWHKFLRDVGYDVRFNPRGYFLRLDTRRFDRWGGVEGYLAYLRGQCNFTPI